MIAEYDFDNALKLAKPVAVYWPARPHETFDPYKFYNFKVQPYSGADGENFAVSGNPYRGANLGSERVITTYRDEADAKQVCAALNAVLHH